MISFFRSAVLSAYFYHTKNGHDSNIELNLNNIFNIDIFSGLGFLAMTSLILAFFLVTSKIKLYYLSTVELRHGDLFYYRTVIIFIDYTLVFK